MLTLRVALVDTRGLRGAPYESAPRLAHWATWGTHRDGTRERERVPISADGQAPSALAPLRLPLAQDPLRGDEAVWLKLLSLSQHTGIESMDALERLDVERDQQSGVVRVALSDLLALATGPQPVRVPLQDPLLCAQLTRTYQTAGAQLEPALRQAEGGALKGELLLDIQLSDRAAGQAVRQRLERAVVDAPAKGVLLYNTPAMVEAMLKARDLTLGAYMPLFYGLEGPNGTKRADAVWPTGPEKSVDSMHMALYASEQGVMPPIGFFLHDPHTRDPAPGADLPRYATHYAPTRETLLLDERCLESSAMRVNMAPSAFCASIRTQHAVRDEPVLRDVSYLHVLNVIQDSATSAANALHYTPDRRFARPALASGPASPPSTTPERAACLASMGAHATMLAKGLLGGNPLGALRASSLAFKPGRFGDTSAGPIQAAADAVELESFDASPIWNLTGSGDCEDSANLAVTWLGALKAHAAMATKLGMAQEVPMLMHAAEVCARRYVMGAVASVTAAYVNTEGRDLSKEEMRAMSDLPRIGDALDQKSKTGGHMAGIWVSKAVVYDQLVRAHPGGAAALDRELPALAAYVRSAAPWERASPSLMLEGTSSVNPYVLGMGDATLRALGTRNPQAVAEAQAQHAWTKGARTLAPTLLDHARVDAGPWYPDAAPADRRGSAFYRGLSILACAEAYADNPIHGQWNIVQTSTHTRGAEFGHFLRHGSDLGLVPSFGSVGRAAWAEKVAPVMACIQNQMAVGALGRFPRGPQEAELALARQGHTLSDPALLLLGGLAPAQQMRALDVHATTAQAHASEMASRLGATPETGSAAVPCTTLCLYTAAWRLKDAAVTQKILDELDMLKARGYLLAHTPLDDKPLAAGDAVMTLRLTLPVPMPAFPTAAAPKPLTFALEDGAPLDKWPGWLSSKGRVKEKTKHVAKEKRLSKKMHKFTQGGKSKSKSQVAEEERYEGKKKEWRDTGGKKPWKFVT